MIIRSDMFLSVSPGSTKPSFINRMQLQIKSNQICSIFTSIYNDWLLISLPLLSPSVLTAIFPGEPGLAGFIGAKDDGSGGDSWSYKSCRAVKWSPPTNQHQTLYRPNAIPVAQPTVSSLTTNFWQFHVYLSGWLLIYEPDRKKKWNSQYNVFRS